MKKNISINLQGIIFHIEEDGYEQLSRYLASIRTYFSNYEGHEEIIADIESRIAEIFSTRLNPGKQVISQEDVQYLITRMGNVTDFEVLEPEQEEIPYTTTANVGADTGTYSETITATGSKKLYRDINRKVVGGVCAGIANYFNIDVVWVRLFFLLLVALGIVSAGVSAATGVIIYIILWVAMPQNEFLPETKVRRLFRDPEDKKLAGVASGLAKYFGVDVTLIRILFLALIFAGGFGILAYIILWIAVPEAVTLTERMQMQGNPVTLAGIEKTLKDNLNMKDQNGEESTLAKLILLPIRLISQIVNWLGKALGPLLIFLISLVRIVAGLFLLVLSVGLTIALFATFLVSLGIIDEAQFIQFDDFPASVYLGGFPRPGLVAGFFVGLIPLLLLFFLSISLLAKRFFLRPIVGWSMFGVWLVSLFIMIATILMFTNNFKRTGEIVTTKRLSVSPYKTLVLDAYSNGPKYEHIYVDVREHTGNEVEVIQRIEAKGKTEADAQRNAQMVSYRVVQRDSMLRFDSSYEFKPGAVFRDQDLQITLMLPKDKKLRLTRDFLYMLPSATFAQNYDTDKITRNTWQVNGDMLECLTCAADTLDTEQRSDYSYFDEGSINVEPLSSGSSVLLGDDEYSTNTSSFDFRDFNAITVSGPYHLQLKQGNNYSIRVRGERDALQRLEIDKNSRELEISYSESTINLFDNREPVLIQITAPDIRKINLSGAIKADIGNVSTNNLEVSLTGATKATLDVRTQNLKINIAGASSSSFIGTTNRLELDAAGACSINAENLRANAVDIETSGVTAASVYATGSIRAEASGASKIEYKGNPQDVTIDTSGASKVTRR